MAKRVSPARPSKEDERTLHIKRGEKIEFPVPARHRLAKFQKLTPVRSAKDITEFVRLWEQVAAANDHPPLTPARLVTQLKKEEIGVLHIDTPNLHIAHRAVVTLNNPLNQLDCDSVTIAGILVARGELVLNCNTLRVE